MIKKAELDIEGHWYAPHALRPPQFYVFISSKLLFSIWAGTANVTILALAKNCWVAHCFRYLTAETEVGSSVPLCASLAGNGLNDS